MSYTAIAGTPLQIALSFAEGSDPPHSLTTQPLIWDGSLSPLGKLLGALISPNVVAALQQLVTPLDQVFAAQWTDAGTQSSAQAAVQQAIVAAKPDAYAIGVTIPRQGTLRAETGNLSQALSDAMPPGTTARQLTLSYLVPGFQASFRETTNSVWGSWADPSYELTFDGELEIAIAIPDDPRVAPVARAVFWARDLNGSASNFFAGWIGFWSIVFDVINGRPLPSGQMPDQSAGVGGAVSSLLQALLQLSQPLAQAYEFGFLQLSVQINNALPGAPPGMTVEIDLTHPADPAPTISNALVPSGPVLMQVPQIVLGALQAHAGDTLGVLGSYFPPAQSTQLTITWNDTTSGSVVKSEVTWGETSSIGTPPAKPTVVTIERHGSYDNADTFTAKPLLPNTAYAFRVRDFDVPGYDVIATLYSDWTYFQTAATDQVELMLDYNGTVLGFATLQSDGSFVTTVILPPSVPPGTYAVWAVFGGQKMAQAAITVIASNAPLPASLAIVDPKTGFPLPGTPLVGDGLVLHLSGKHFAPGPVGLFVDSPSGKGLGSAVADASGAFGAVVTWPAGVYGGHDIVAQQGTTAATASVFSEMPPQ